MNTLLSNRRWNGLPVVIFGTSGAAKETLFLLEDINRTNTKTFDFVGFVSKENEVSEQNNISEEIFFEFADKFSCLGVILPFGEPKIKKIILDNLLPECKSNIVFPNLIHPSAIVSPTVKFGGGNIICANVIIEPDATMGNFVFINIASTIGHDTVIEDFTTINISANISGNCQIKQSALIGTNCAIKQGVTIGENSVCGMSAIITKNVDDYAVMVSAKSIKNNN